MISNSQNLRSFLLALSLVSTVFELRADEMKIIGSNARGQTSIPIDASSIVQLSCGREHVLGLKRDGSIISWGEPGNGRTTVPPVQRAIAVAAGTYHNLALLPDGKVTAWGFSGENMTRVPPAASNIVQIAAGTYHNLALRSDGFVLAWGFNGNGRLIVPRGMGPAVAIAVGRDHSVALNGSGKVFSWGLNDAGQTKVPTTLSQVIAIAAGDAHTVVLQSDGTVAAWGNNLDGQCNVPAGLKSVVAVAAGAVHSVALKADGTVVAWGNNKYGQTKIPADSRTVVAISAGGFQTVLLYGTGPTIASQPISQSAIVGRGVNFSVVASSSNPLNYQWFFNGVAIASSTVPSSTSPTLALSDLKPADAGIYSVDVSDGRTVIRSAPALLTVRSSISLQRPEMLPGQALRFSLSDASGSPFGQADLRLFDVEWSTDLQQWQQVRTQPVLQAGSLVVVDSDANTKDRFYRLLPKP
jgi:hypothetical protein